jgi:hypothetical protein
MPIRFYSSLLKRGIAVRQQPTYAELASFLQRAADALQDSITDIEDDRNDPLAMEIYALLERIPKTARSKKGYGYDTSGETQSGSGSQGTQKNVQDNSTGNAIDGHGSPKNPANSMSDNGVAEEFPELNRPSKIRFLPPRGLR